MGRLATICIPIYNREVITLVEALVYEIKRADLPVNIQLIDDASTNHCGESNALLSSHYVQYTRLTRNVGRAKIRNLFLTLTDTPLLIFIDCDSEIHSKDYIQTYLHHFRDPQNQVIYGGRIYPDTCKRSERLEWLYGNKRIAANAEKRSREGNRAFLTNNFALRREILETHPFDESIPCYGYEDVRFQFTLSQAGIQVLHIDNVVCDSGFDSNRTVLMKMEMATRSLKYIFDKDPRNPLRKEMKLMRYYDKLNRVCPLFITQSISIILIPFIRTFAHSFPSLFWLDTYKLILLYRYKVSC
ncbi:glycosyltransferase [Halosquirtibacter laminarini]|uniref:Glycosyltransferase n=1 Tax=Halosquirtibacter laminarini TaxID=3374600 RepID=A0AC61NJI2_9BACT|nr:glycosyltransferase [Prolixibacteraceae bacterium]